MSSGKVLLGVLAGAAVGATLGILFAPDNGSNTRKRISQKSDEYAEGLEEKFNKFIDSINKKYETVKEEVQHQMTGDGEFKPKEGKAEVKAAMK